MNAADGAGAGLAEVLVACGLLFWFDVGLLILLLYCKSGRGGDVERVSKEDVVCKEKSLDEAAWLEKENGNESSCRLTMK